MSTPTQRIGWIPALVVCTIVGVPALALGPVDGEVGACGATGRGEAVIISSGSRIVVENMRHGMDPRDAIRDVLGGYDPRSASPVFAVRGGMAPTVLIHGTHDPAGVEPIVTEIVGVH